MPDVVGALPVDCWRRIFCNDRPVVVEIGPGRGEFLVASARRDPARNFYAIEHSAARTREIAARLARSGVDNARVIAGDATCLLEWIPVASVSAFYVLFPDPWWKRRHFKRRLWTAPFVAALARTLIRHGTVELVTDVGEYFAMAQEYLDAEPRLEPVLVGEAEALETSFARKARQCGATLHRSVHRRR